MTFPHSDHLGSHVTLLIISLEPSAESPSSCDLSFESRCPAHVPLASLSEGFSWWSCAFWSIWIHHGYSLTQGSPGCTVSCVAVTESTVAMAHHAAAALTKSEFLCLLSTSKLVNGFL